MIKKHKAHLRFWRRIEGFVPDFLRPALLRSAGTVRQLVLGPYTAAILTRTANGYLLVPTTDMMVGRRLAFNGCYDTELLKVIAHNCNIDSKVLFVGAHVGSLAIPVAKNVRRVVAIEAHPGTFDLLRMNVSLNGLCNIELHNFAAGDKCAKVPFLASSLNSGGSGIEMGQERQEEAHLYGSVDKLAVQMNRLDDVFPSESFDLIVMDIEGSEALALKGMPNLLSRSRALLVEVFEHHLDRIAKITDKEFLNLFSRHYDEAIILPEKPGPGELACLGPYPQANFMELMSECRARRTTNVLFCKVASTVQEDPTVPLHVANTARSN